MSDQDDRDLAAAFASLRAPRSTADYADRVPTVDAVGRVSARRWPQALAGVLAVAIGVAGAGTFLALRNARQTGNSAATAGYPAARVDAAMAFDSTTGRTVMYGGSSASGSPLTDTWAWDGTAWSPVTGRSPGPLLRPSMSDDPADGGVLLIGLPEPASSGGGVVGCAVAGSVGSGGGTVLPANPSAISSGPSAQLTRPANQTLPTRSSGPASAPASTAVAAPPVSGCPLPSPAPPMQTWLLSATGWTEVARGPNPGTDSPGIGAAMAYDATSHEVVAVSIGGICVSGGPLRAGGQPQVMCPLLGAPQQGPPAVASPAIRCPAGLVPATCTSYGPSMSTWTWSDGRWTRQGGAILPGVDDGTVVAGAPDLHATLIVDSYSSTSAPCALGLDQGSAPPSPVGPTCPAPPPALTTGVYSWAGSAWASSSNQPGPESFSLSGAAVASSAGRAIALTESGKLYTWSTASPQWTLESQPNQPDGRRGAAMAEGPGNSIVLFGGVRFGGRGGFTGYGGGPQPGADTWTWNGSAWRLAAGVLAPTPAPISPFACPDVKQLSNPCVGKPVPVQVSGLPTIIVPAPASATPSPS